MMFECVCKFADRLVTGCLCDLADRAIAVTKRRSRFFKSVLLQITIHWLTVNSLEDPLHVRSG